MAFAKSLGPEVSAVGRALGLLKVTGGELRLEPDFFTRPAHYVMRMISSPAQRQGLLDALYSLAPPALPRLGETTADTGRKHPLLQESGTGRLFLAVKGVATGTLTLGLSAEVQVPDGPTLTLELPLVKAEGETLTEIAGTVDSPLRIAVNMSLEGGSAVSVALLMVRPPDVDESRLLVRLSPAGKAAFEFDPTAPPRDFGPLITALLQTLLAMGGPSVPSTIVDHLPGVLGLADGLPPFPIDRLATDAGALRTWLRKMLTSRAAGGRSALRVWLEHVAGLLGAPDLPGGDEVPTEQEPLALPLLRVGSTEISLTAGLREAAGDPAGVLVLGARARIAGAGIDAEVRAEAALLALPLAGAEPPKVAERIELIAVSPAGPGALVPPGTAPAISVGSARAGVRYEGGIIAPTLELREVSFGIGSAVQTFTRLDLTDADALGAAAKDALYTAIRGGLGTGAPDVQVLVEAILTLTGLGREPGLDLERLPTAPTRAIADYYRALRGTPQGWSDVLRAVASLMGAPPGLTVLGTGHRDDPWRVFVMNFGAPASGRPLGMYLAIWDDAEAGSTTVALRLGLRVELGSATGSPGAEWTAALQSEVLAFDLPQDAEGTVRLIGEQRGELRVSPPPAAPAGVATGVSVEASLLAFAASWRPGTQLQCQARVEGVKVGAGESVVELGTLRFPGYDTGSIDAEALWGAVRRLLGRVAGAWGGPSAEALAAVLGLGSPGALGLPGELPPLALPASGDLGSLLGDPGTALRNWLALLASDAAAVNGTPFLASLRHPLRALLTGRLPSLPGLPLPAHEIPLGGSGTWKDPWTIPIHGQGGLPVELLAWIDPEGPPPDWALPILETLENSFPSASDVIGAAQALAAYLPASPFEGLDPSMGAGALQALDAVLEASDGVVPLDAAIPADAAWTTGLTVDAAHPALPRAPAAIEQILARSSALTGGLAAEQWAVVLLAPALAGEQAWDELLTRAASSAGAPIRAEQISLRQGTLDPMLVDLGAVRAASHYVVDLADDGTRSLADVTRHLKRVVDRIRAVKPQARVLLVAHSYLGVVARQLTSEQPAAVLGLITLGAPLLPVQVPAFTDPTMAEAVLLAQRLTQRGSFGSPALQGAIDHLASALDGYLAGSAGTPPRAAAYPVAAFARASDTPPALSGVPAFAIAGQTGGNLCRALAESVRGAATDAFGRPSATHLGYGIRVGLELPAARAGEPDVEVALRLDLGRFGLSLDALEPPHPARELSVRARISRPDGWLLGGPGNGTPQVARVRAAELEGWLSSGATRPSGVSITLHDAALRGSGAPIIELSDARAPALLAALLRELSVAAPAGGRLEALLRVLAELELTQPDPDGRDVPRADALEALRTDAAGYLGARLPALLDRAEGLLGLRRPEGMEAGGGRFALALEPLPLEVVVQSAPWRVTVRTLAEGLGIAGGGVLSARGSLRLDTVEAELEGHFSLHGLRIEREADSGRVRLHSTWLNEPVTLVPADPAVLRAALGPLVPRLVADAVLGAVLEHLFGDGFPVRPVTGLLLDAAEWLRNPAALGNGEALQPEKVNALLTVLAQAAGLASTPDRPLMLPGGVGVRAEAGAAGLRLALSPPLQLWLEGGGAAPGFGFNLSVPLPGSWGDLGISLGVGAGGAVALSVTPAALGVRVELLPRVAGLAELVEAIGNRLLPEILDALVGALSTPVPSPLLQAVLDVATALDVYAPVGGFQARAAKLAQLGKALTSGDLDAVIGPATVAAGAVLRVLLGEEQVPPQAPDRPTLLVVRVPLGPVGLVELGADLGVMPPSISLALTGLQAGPASLTVSAGYSGTGGLEGLTAAASIRVAIDTGTGLVLTPKLEAEFTEGALHARFLPLSADELAIQLAPVLTPPTEAQLLRLAEEWALPLAATLLLRATDKLLNRPLWSAPDALTARQVLVSAKVVMPAEESPDRLMLRLPLPSPFVMLGGALKALTALNVPLPGGLSLSLVENARRYGLGLHGEVELPGQHPIVSLRFGAPTPVAEAWRQAGQKPTLYLLELPDESAPSESAQPKLAVSLSLVGLGVGLEGGKGKALVDTGSFRLGGAAAYVSAEIPLLGTSTSASLHGGAVELSGLGLPLAAPGEGGTNPVAASLLRVEGGGGDKTPVNPPLDMTVIGGAGTWAVSFNGQPEVRLPVRRGFGPLHVEEIVIGMDPGERARLAIDGSVSLAGLTVAVDDLSLRLPLRKPLDINSWELDLGGLAVGISTPAVSLAGGLMRAMVGGVPEYRGAISVSVADRGLTAIGAYSRPSDALGRYTSLFVFLAVPIPLGGPPYLFVLGLAGGAGINRRLLVPRDPAAVPSFPLVAAMSGGFPGNPMEALARIGTDIPPSRGAFWLAAGVRFTTFELIRTLALAYVSIDRGLEVGLLGMMQMALPTVEAAVVSVELAMAARFSTTERVLSVRAALTPNSWLISRDCQLTGGFAFVTWFDRAEAVLSIGGYHPKFSKPAHYPEVPRVGFHWAVGRGIVVKGGAYFAITPKALMLGGRLEASYDIPPVRAWFTVALDVIITWDPMRYVADAMVLVGGSFFIPDPFSKTLRPLGKPISLSLRANVHIEGPPLYAHVTLEVPVIGRIELEFGEVRPQSYLDWPSFRDKYLCGGDAGARATKISVLSGMRPTPESASNNGQSEALAWLVSPELTLRVESRMPASFWRLTGVFDSNQSPAGVRVPSSVDFVPMDAAAGDFTGALVVALERWNNGVWERAQGRIEVVPRQGQFPAALFRGGAHGLSDRGSSNVAALGSLELRIPTVANERTGKLGNNALPLSGMVAESPVRPLPLKRPTTLSVPLALAGAEKTLRVAASPTVEAEPDVAPRLRAAVPPLRERRRPRQTTPTVLPRPGERLRPGVSQVWDLPDRAARGVGLQLEGSGKVRVTALSGTGSPLLDVEGPVAAIAAELAEVPLGTARLVISGLGAEERAGLRAGPSRAPATGWQLHTALLQVGSGTLLAPGATVFTPGPYHAPRGFRRGDAPCRVPADRVAAALPRLTTRLRAETEVVVVQVDRVGEGEGPGDLVVTARRGELGTPAVVSQGGRICLIYPARAVAGAPIEVLAGSAKDFRLAGVVGLQGKVEAWRAALARNPHLRLVDDVPHAGAGPDPEVNVQLGATGSEKGRTR
ncbi:MAG TPA: DUF6603 domain-containing protein [Myxococcaceae bacterium]|nr:DUF6603 domain-containing protein [Myxococcaceae bacterium]